MIPLDLAGLRRGLAREGPGPMHELSIATSIVESVLEFVEKHGIKEVVEVRLLIGELMGVEQEQLRFCYSAITKETALENSSLEFDRISASVHCPHCGYHGRPKYWDDALSFMPIITLQCPECGKAVEATQGTECAIKTIRYVAEELDEYPTNKREIARRPTP